MRIDLNCDLGEGSAYDADLMPWITSANIACGAHAGDETTMRATVKLAREHDVAIGAHPGHRDRDHFGRLELSIPPAEVFQLVLDQIRLLQRIAAEEGANVKHVKPHGALYNQAARDPALACAIAVAVREADPALVLFGLSGSALISAGRDQGLATASETFADRSYQADGSLTPRSLSGALLATVEDACDQVLLMIREGRVKALDGSIVALKTETICLHGDGPHAVGFAKALRQMLDGRGIHLSRITPGFPLR